MIKKENFYNHVLEVKEILFINIELLYDKLKDSDTYIIVFFEDVNGSLYSTKVELKGTKDYSEWRKQQKNIKKFDGIVL